MRVIQNSLSVVRYMLPLACLCVVFVVSTSCYPTTTKSTQDVRAEEQWCRANPIQCTQKDIAKVKKDIEIVERSVKRHEESARVFGAPDCADPWCEEQLLKHSKKVDEGHEVIAQETNKLRELERKLADLQRGSDGSGGGNSGGSSGGSSH